MRVEVTRLREDGRIIPNWRIGTVKKHAGLLTLQEHCDDRLHRAVSRATLVDRHISGEDLVSPLIDATVIWIKYNTYAITGTEQVGEQDFKQTWHVEIIGQTRHGITVSVAQMRNEGVALPRAEWDSKRKLAILSMGPGGDWQHSRAERVAVVNGMGPIVGPVFTSLSDATVIWIRDNAMAISGFERILQADYAQTWHVLLV